MKEKTFWRFFGVAFFVNLAFWGGVIYVAIHFLGKVW